MKRVWLGSSGNCVCSHVDDSKNTQSSMPERQIEDHCSLHNHSLQSSHQPFYDEYYNGVQSMSKVTCVVIQLENESLGITLRGGIQPSSVPSSGALVVTKIRPNGPVDKEGTIHVGDRLLAINDFSLENVTHSEAQEIMQTCLKDQTCRLTIEYDVSVMSSLRLIGTPLMVEIESPQLYQLGITFTNTVHNNAVLIEDIKVGSIAERCGALFPGDTILSVNDTKIEGTKMAATNIYSLFHQYCDSQDVICLEILPAPVLSQKLSSDPYVLNSEKMHIEIQADETGDLGITVVSLDDQLCIDQQVIYQIDSGSPADRCERLQCGDRIISINGLVRSRTAFSKAPIKLSYFKPYESVHLEVEYNIERHVSAAFGTFSVHIRKCIQYDLGILLSESNSGHVIIDVKSGSPARRSGALFVGDIVLAVNDLLLDDETTDNVSRILASPMERVILLVHRHLKQYCGNENVIRTVQLKRRGGPLGITIAGSEDTKDPILISSLAADGVAKQTGALHVGDQLIGIDGRSLHCKPLSTAITALQQAGDTIILKVVRDLVLDKDEAKSRDLSPYSHSTFKTRLTDHSPNFTKRCLKSVGNDDSCESFLQLSDPSLNQVSKFTQPDIYSWPHQVKPPDLTLFTHNSNRDPRSIENDQHANGFKVQNYFYDVCKVTLFKDTVYDDFGFSISDGLYEKGVFINRMRRGGPADRSQVLQPYDRIIQVNETRTDDFDCCMTVPLIAAVGDRITLSVARRKPTSHFHHFDLEFK